MAMQRPSLPIRFASVTVDPRRPRRAAGAAGPQTRAGDWMVVQFTDPLTREQQARLKQAYGLALRQYVPEQAYLERLQPEVLARLKEDPRVSAILPYRPKFKIMPRIGEHRFKTEERLAVQGLWLRCVLFQDAATEEVARELERLGARDIKIVDDRPRGGDPKIHFIVDTADEVLAIAGIPSVKLVEEMPEVKEDNANAAGTNQSGNSATRSIWDQGLHGENQIIGMLDSARLDINHCFFQDPVNNAPGVAHRKVLDLRGSALAGDL